MMQAHDDTAKLIIKVDPHEPMIHVHVHTFFKDGGTFDHETTFDPLTAHAFAMNLLEAIEAITNREKNGGN